jgi:hypothetical protein
MSSLIRNIENKVFNARILRKTKEFPDEVIE